MGLLSACSNVAWKIEYNTKADRDAGKAEIITTSVKDAIVAQIPTAKDLVATFPAKQIPVTTLETKYELVPQPASACALINNQDGCVNGFGCKFTPEVPAVTTSTPAEYTCSVPPHECTATGTEAIPSETACTGTKATEQACKDLSPHCTGQLTTPAKTQTAKIDATCVKRQCAELAIFGKGGCEMLGCKFTAGAAQVGTITTQCIAEATLTNQVKKTACAAASVSQCGMTGNGGNQCCKVGQTQSSNYQAAGPNTCTAPTSTTTTTTTETYNLISPTTISGTSGMMISVATMIVMAVMMS